MREPRAAGEVGARRASSQRLGGAIAQKDELAGPGHPAAGLLPEQHAQFRGSGRGGDIAGGGRGRGAAVRPRR